MRPILITALISGCFGLAACGQSGPLRLPPGESPGPSSPGVATPTLPPGAHNPATEEVTGSSKEHTAR